MKISSKVFLILSILFLIASILLPMFSFTGYHSYNLNILFLDFDELLLGTSLIFAGLYRIEWKNNYDKNIKNNINAVGLLSIFIGLFIVISGIFGII